MGNARGMSHIWTLPGDSQLPSFLPCSQPMYLYVTSSMSGLHALCCQADNMEIRQQTDSSQWPSDCLSLDRLLQTDCSIINLKTINLTTMGGSVNAFLHRSSHSLHVTALHVNSAISIRLLALHLVIITCTHKFH